MASLISRSMPFCRVATRASGGPCSAQVALTVSSSSKVETKHFTSMLWKDGIAFFHAQMGEDIVETGR